MKRIMAVAFMAVFAMALCSCQSNISDLNYPTIKDMITEGKQALYDNENKDGVQDISIQNELTDGITSAIDDIKKTSSADRQEDVPEQDPSYIKYYTPLSPMPLEWYSKYHIITDFQFF